MASPQKETGFTSISNELLEALFKIRLTGVQKDLIFYIIRKTYGFNKKEDRIPLSQFCESLNIVKEQVCRDLKNLEKLNLIIRKKQPNNGITIYAIQKDYSLWITSDTGVTVSSESQCHLSQQTSDNRVNRVVTTESHSKDNIQNTIQNTYNVEFVKTNIDHVLPKVSSTEIQEIINYLNQRTAKRFRVEAHKRNIINRLKQYSVDDLKKVIDNCVSSNFFVENPQYLRPATLFGSDQKVDQYLNLNLKPQKGIIYKHEIPKETQEALSKMKGTYGSK